MTDEPEAKAKPYVETNKMEYLVGFGGGASAYQSRGIPNAWLVDPTGKIVYEGHPSRINEALIEEHIKSVRLTPTFELGDGLEKASKLLSAGKYGKGIGELEKVIEKSDDADLVAKAKQAIADVNAFGADELKAVDQYAEAGYYLEGFKKLKILESAFKRTEFGETVEAKLEQWEDDDTIQAEIAGEQVIAHARELMSKGKHKDAARALSQVTKGKKYEGTKVRDKAQELFDEAVSKL